MLLCGTLSSQLISTGWSPFNGTNFNWILLSSNGQGSRTCSRRLLSIIAKAKKKPQDQVGCPHTKCHNTQQIMYKHLPSTLILRSLHDAPSPSPMSKMPLWLQAMNLFWSCGAKDIQFKRKGHVFDWEFLPFWRISLVCDLI